VFVCHFGYLCVVKAILNCIDTIVLSKEEEQQEEQDRNATTTYDLNVQNRKRKLEFLDQSRQCAGKPHVIPCLAI